MIKWLGVLASVSLLAAPVPAWARRHYHSYSQTLSGGSDYYTARSGHQVHRPMRSDGRPAGATARCRDSSWSFSESHRGTCSHHGGVAAWL